MNVEIRGVGPADVILLCDNMRDIDLLECKAMSDKEPFPAILEAIAKSERTLCAYADGDLVAIWGIGKMGMFSRSGSPWMLCTPRVYDKQVRRQFLRRSREEFSSLTRGFSRLSNVVHKDNALSIRWLKWLGFDFPEGHEVELKGEPFVHFVMEVEDVPADA